MRGYWRRKEDHNAWAQHRNFRTDPPDERATQSAGPDGFGRDRSARRHARQPDTGSLADRCRHLRRARKRSVATHRRAGGAGAVYRRRALIEKLQMRIFDGLERAAPATVLGQRTGELAAIATHDAELMERFYAHTLADYVGAMLVPAAALAGLYAVAPPLAWVLAPFLLLVATVPVWLARYAARQGKQVMRELGQLNADTLEFIAGQRELAVFGQAEAFVQRLLQRTRTLGKAQQHYGVRSG